MITILACDTNNIKELFNDEDITICLSNGKVSLGCRVDLIEGKPITYGMFNPGIDDTVLMTLETAYSNKDKVSCGISSIE